MRYAVSSQALIYRSRSLSNYFLTALENNAFPVSEKTNKRWQSDALLNQNERCFSFGGCSKDMLANKSKKLSSPSGLSFLIDLFCSCQLLSFFGPKFCCVSPPTKNFCRRERQGELGLYGVHLVRRSMSFHDTSVENHKYHSLQRFL